MEENSQIAVKVLFFGATADVAGARKIELALDPESTAATALKRVTEAYPKLTSHKLLLSLNEEYAEGSETLKDGDEVAVFTAVSGG